MDDVHTVLRRKQRIKTAHNITYWYFEWTFATKLIHTFIGSFFPLIRFNLRLNYGFWLSLFNFPHLFYYYFVNNCLLSSFCIFKSKVSPLSFFSLCDPWHYISFLIFFGCWVFQILLLINNKKLLLKIFIEIIQMMGVKNKDRKVNTKESDYCDETPKGIGKRSCAISCNYFCYLFGWDFWRGSRIITICSRILVGLAQHEFVKQWLNLHKVRCQNELTCIPTNTEASYLLFLFNAFPIFYLSGCTSLTLWHGFIQSDPKLMIIKKKKH